MFWALRYIPKLQAAVNYTNLLNYALNYNNPEVKLGMLTILL